MPPTEGEQPPVNPHPLFEQHERDEIGKLQLRSLEDKKLHDFTPDADEKYIVDYCQRNDFIGRYSIIPYSVTNLRQRMKGTYRIYVRDPTAAPAESAGGVFGTPDTGIEDPALRATHSMLEEASRDMRRREEEQRKLLDKREEEMKNRETRISTAELEAKTGRDSEIITLLREQQEHDKERWEKDRATLSELLEARREFESDDAERQSDRRGEDLDSFRKMLAEQKAFWGEREERLERDWNHRLDSQKERYEDRIARNTDAQKDALERADRSREDEIRRLKSDHEADLRQKDRDHEYAIRKVEDKVKKAHSTYPDQNMPEEVRTEWWWRKMDRKYPEIGAIGQWGRMLFPIIKAGAAQVGIDIPNFDDDAAEEEEPETISSGSFSNTPERQLENFPQNDAATPTEPPELVDDLPEVIRPGSL